MGAAERWWSTRLSAGLKVGKDEVDDVGLGDHGQELHFGAASGAPEWIHFEDFSQQTRPGCPARGCAGRSRLGLLLRFAARGRRFGRADLKDRSAGSIRVGPVVPCEVLAAIGNRPHSGCFEGIRCPGMTSKLLPPG